MATKTPVKNTKQNTANKKADIAHKGDSDEKMPLGWKNYMWMLIGFGMLILGFALMSGGGSDDPNVFDYSMFSFRRITLAPIIVLAGFGVEIFAIMKRFGKK